MITSIYIQTKKTKKKKKEREQQQRLFLTVKSLFDCRENKEYILTHFHSIFSS